MQASIRRSLHLSVISLLAAAAIWIFAASAHGQTPPPQNPAADAAIEAGKRIARSEAERAAGRVFTPEQIDIIKTVLGQQTGTPSRDEDDDERDVSDRDREDDREDEDRDDEERDDKAEKAEKKSKGKNKAAKGKGRGKNKGLPPGLAKRKSLPPGLQRKLERGGSLPPGLAKRDLPEDLTAQLGKPAEGTERTIVDNDVVLIEKGTGIVLDVIKDVIAGGAKK